MPYLSLLILTTETTNCKIHVELKISQIIQPHERIGVFSNKSNILKIFTEEGVNTKNFDDLNEFYLWLSHDLRRISPVVTNSEASKHETICQSLQMFSSNSWDSNRLKLGHSFIECCNISCSPSFRPALAVSRSACRLRCFCVPLR